MPSELAPNGSVDRIHEWLPGPSLTRERAESTIRALFPEVEAKGARHIGSGTLYDVFLTIDDWAFRFPRTDWSGDLFEQEATNHKFIAQIIPSHIRLPRVELLAAPSEQFPYPIAGHRYISGIGADELDERLLPTFAREIATFLNALHSAPTPLARAAGMHEFQMDEGRFGWAQHGINHVMTFRGLDPVLDGALDWLKTMTLLPPKFDAPWHPVHGGLEARHVLVDPSTGSVRGVIDWTDSHLGDAAGDFVFLVTWRGWQFAEEVLRLYRRPTDAEFRARLRHGARFLSLMQLSYAEAEGLNVPAHIRGVHNAFAEGGE
jgi:aminoglycoside 2''-phosphotransferase